MHLHIALTISTHGSSTNQSHDHRNFGHRNSIESDLATINGEGGRGKDRTQSPTLNATNSNPAITSKWIAPVPEVINRRMDIENEHDQKPDFLPSAAMNETTRYSP